MAKPFLRYVHTAGMNILTSRILTTNATEVEEERIGQSSFADVSVIWILDP